MNPGERIAVADLGTNSTRLLVADPGTKPGSLKTIDRRTTVTRLGENVDATGELAEDAMERVLSTLDEYARAADEHGAQRRIAVATSAVRDAGNGEAFVSEVRNRGGFDVRTITGDEEAQLTFLGATAARNGSEPILVVDIGGGSTEYVVGTPGDPPTFHVSTRLGSVRQSERHLSGDPPAPQELEALAAAARDIVSEETPLGVREDVHEGIAVAGTATTLASIDLALEPYDPMKVDGHRLTLDACVRILAELAVLPLEERKTVTGLHPDRAATIVAGAVILVESMRIFGLDSVQTSEADILHGAALESGAGGKIESARRGSP